MTRHATRRFTVVRTVHSLMLLVVLVITVFRQARFGDDVSNESWTIITIFLVLRGYFATLALNARDKLSLCQNKFSFLLFRKVCNVTVHAVAFNNSQPYVSLPPMKYVNEIQNTFAVSIDLISFLSKRNMYGVSVNVSLTEREPIGPFLS